MSFWNAYSDTRNPADGALGLGPANEKILPWALVVYGPCALDPLESPGPGTAHEETQSYTVGRSEATKLHSTQGVQRGFFLYDSPRCFLCLWLRVIK